VASSGGVAGSLPFFLRAGRSSPFRPIRRDFVFLLPRWNRFDQFRACCCVLGRPLPSILRAYAPLVAFGRASFSLTFDRSPFPLLDWLCCRSLSCGFCRAGRHPLRLVPPCLRPRQYIPRFGYLGEHDFSFFSCCVIIDSLFPGHSLFPSLWSFSSSVSRLQIFSLYWKRRSAWVVHLVLQPVGTPCISIFSMLPPAYCTSPYLSKKKMWPPSASSFHFQMCFPSFFFMGNSERCL